MSILERYNAYAAAFERAYADDDWSHIAPFFTDDAIYEIESPAQRDPALEGLERSVNAFDRLMDERIPDFEPPTAEGSRVTMRWRVTYRKSGLPDVVLSGVEVAEFRDDRISALRAAVDADAQQALEAWMKAHGAELVA